MLELKPGTKETLLQRFNNKIYGWFLEGIKKRQKKINKLLKDKQPKQNSISPSPIYFNNEGKINLCLDKLKLRDIYQAEFHYKK